MIRKLLPTGRSRIVVLIVVLIGLGWGAFESVTRSQWLGNRIRVWMVQRIEAATGLEVSIERLTFGKRRLDLEIEGLALRAGGIPDQPPLLTVSRISARVGALSFLGGRTYLQTLQLQNPIVRVSVREDGAWSVPWRPGKEGRTGLEVGRIEVTGGAIEWNGEPYGIEFRGTGLQMDATFDPAQRAHSIRASLAEPTWGSVVGEPLKGSAIEISATVSPHRIEVHTATFLGESIQVEVSNGSVDLPASRAEGHFTMEVNLADVDAFLGSSVPGISGVLTADGTMQWRAGDRQLDYVAALTVRDAGAYGVDGLGPFECSVEGNLERLSLTGLRGDLWGGKVDGAIEVLSMSDTPRISANGSLTNLSIARATAYADIGSIAWGGWLNAGVTSSGTLSGGIVSDLEIDVRPSSDPSKIPVEGEGTLRYASGDGRIAVRDLRLAVGRGQATLQAEGSIGVGADADLAVVAEFDSRTALERLLAFVRPETAILPGMPDGRMSFRGQARGPLGNRDEAVLDGEFSIRDFEFAGQRWDHASFRGAVTGSQIEIRDADATDGNGRLSLHGTLPLTSELPLDIRASIHGFDARKVALASGFGLLVEGAIGVEANASGSIESPVVESRIVVSSPGLFGESFDQMEADIDYGSGKFNLSSALVRRGESTLRANGSIEHASKEIALNVTSTRWRLEEFGLARILAPGVSGTVEFGLDAAGVVSGTGSLGALDLDGHWEVAALRWNDSDLGRWNGTVKSSPEDRHIDFAWSAETLGGTVTGEAAVQTADTSDYHGTVSFREIDTAILWRSLAPATGALNGSVTGSASFGGMVGAPGSFGANGTIDTAEFRIGAGEGKAFRISNLFPMRWSIKDSSLRFDSMSLGGAETDFLVDGSVPLVGGRELDLSLNGTASLLLLQGFLPGTEWEGAATIGLRIGGTIDDPSITGSMEFLQAGLAPSEFPFRLSGLTGSVRIENSEGRIENLIASSGGGTVRFDGVVAYRDAGLEYRLHAVAEDMRVDYPKTVSSVVDGNFTLAGVGSRSILTGSLLISRMSIRSDVSFADLFASLDRPAANRISSPTLQGMQLNLHIGAVPQLPVETDLIRNVAAEMELEVGGTVASPSVLGTASIVRGEVRMLGTHYQINRGDIRFLNPLQAEPVLDAELETRIRNIDLVLVLSGPARSLDLSYRSDPPIPFHDLVSLIAVGKEPTVDPSIATQRRMQQQSLVQTGADALLSQAIAEPVDRRLQRFFGVSRIKVDPQVGGLEANPNPRISTEQQIGEEVTLIYSYDLSAAQQQSIRIEWNPNRRWSFLVTRDQNGLVGSDILFKVRLP